MRNLSPDATQEEIVSMLQRLDERLSRIESHLDLPPLEEEEASSPAVTPADAEEREEELELQIGQNWFAKAGIVVLALGIAFLLTFPYQNVPPVLPSLFGYLLVAGIFALSRALRETYDQISRYLLGGGLLLLFFATLRLAYFTTAPAVTSSFIEMPLLLAVVTFCLVVSARRRSQYLASLSITMGFLTALLGGEPLFVFFVAMVLSCVVALLSIRFAWTAVLVYGIILAYCTHLLWWLNNPLLGNPLRMAVEPQGNLFFLIADASIFAVATLRRGADRQESFGVLATGMLNGAGSYGLFLLLTLVSFKAGFALWHFAAAAVFLSLAVLFWKREKSKYSTFVYAMLGYIAISVAIVYSIPLPDSFIWLCWESVLVLGTAVWFRSRFIVVANFCMYLVVFMAYLASATTVNAISLSFGVAALLSARILNWRRDRLELKTELMRNAYLGSALLFIPYALYHSVPKGVVSLSWLGVALFYYAASRYLKSRKYRWMALMTTGLTIIHVFIVDLVGLEPTLRIVSFLVLGSVLLIISMIYTRRRSQQAKGGHPPAPPPAV